MRKAYRADRCALCGKRREHRIHDVRKPTPLWRRLLGLAWPRWMWEANVPRGFVGVHGHVKRADETKAARSTHEMKRLKNRFKRRTRKELP